uniref:Uncharacterized protein n=1 Tax=Anopheles epiroticus TaxID=199890 RepID=A0A182PJL0_9DIPT
MKLCLLIATAVAIATCYALPVPKEEVFTVYPVNSALAQESSNLTVAAKSEPLSTTTDAAFVAKDASNEKPLEDKPVETKPEEVKTVPETVNEPTTVKEEATKVSVPTMEAKSAPLTDSSDAKVEESPATAAPTEEASTTVASNDELRLAASESIVAAEPKVVVPETVAEEPKSVVAEKSVGNEAVKEDMAPVGKSAESVKVEEKKEESVEAKTDELKVAEVKTVAEEKPEKPAEEPMAQTTVEPSQVRSTINDLPADRSVTDVKAEEKVADQVAVKTVTETQTEDKKPVVEDVQETRANVPEPQTEGRDEVKPTKVRAAPIIEDLKVSQPVEAEPAVAKIHVTVIQEDVLLDTKPVAQKEAVQADVPVTEAEEEKTTEATATTTVAAAEQEVKSGAVEAVEKAPETKDEVNADMPVEVKIVEVLTESKPKASETVEVSKVEDSKVTPEAVVIVMPSAKSEDVTTVVAVAENTDKPAESVEEKTVQEVRSAGASEEVPEPATTTAKAEEQAKAVEGSSQPGSSESSTTVKEEAKDQSDSVSTTTLSSVTEQDTTTVSPITTTEPEPVPTPAKQKAKKQVPQRNYCYPGSWEAHGLNEQVMSNGSTERVAVRIRYALKEIRATLEGVFVKALTSDCKQVSKCTWHSYSSVAAVIMPRSVVVALLLVLCSALVPRIHSAPQGSIDFLLGDEELQAVVKPIAVDSPSTPAAQEQTEAYEEDQQTNEVQATVDPIENEQQTEEPQPDQPDAEDYTDEEQYTADPQDDLLDPVTESPKEENQNTTSANDSPTTAPSVATSTATKDTTSTPAPKAAIPSTTPDSVENNSSEEQLTTNPIVVPESEEQTTTESSEDSNQLAQDVNDFIHSLADEVRSSARDKPRRPEAPKPNPPPAQYSTVLPTVLPDRYDWKSVESNEDDDQVQLKVNPNEEQTANGPSLTEDQFRALLEKLPWFGQQRFPGYDQWQHQGFPQRSSWQHRDDRQRHYQSHGSDSYQGHGFHRGSWH